MKLNTSKQNPYLEVVDAELTVEELVVLTHVVLEHGKVLEGRDVLAEGARVLHQ